MSRSRDGRWLRKCEVCGEEFHQLKPGQRTCPLPKPCRARLPHNTGGIRVKAGLEPRTCENPECGKQFQPVRANQIACSRSCLLKCSSYITAQKQAETIRAGKRRGSGYRRLENASNLDQQRFRNLRSNLRRLYGITITWDQYLEWLERQDGYCKICGRGVNGKNAHTDHDHETGQLRDQLCHSCNRGLGLFKDSPDLLRAAAAYIERHRQNQLPDPASPRCRPLPGGAGSGPDPVTSKGRSS